MVWDTHQEMNHYRLVFNMIKKKKKAKKKVHAKKRIRLIPGAVQR